MKIRHLLEVNPPESPRTFWDGSVTLGTTEPLPPRLTVRGDFIIATNIDKLPDDLEVQGDLEADGQGITALPKKLYVGGMLMMMNNQITTIPENITVRGSIILLGNEITTIPPNLVAHKMLNVSFNPLTTISPGVKVFSNMFVNDTLLRTLPDDLIVKQKLSIRNTKIDKIPSTLQCSILEIQDTPLTWKDTLRCPGVGYVDFGNDDLSAIVHYRRAQLTTDFQNSNPQIKPKRVPQVMVEIAEALYDAGLGHFAK